LPLLGSLYEVETERTVYVRNGCRTDVLGRLRSSYGQESAFTGALISACGPVVVNFLEAGPAMDFTNTAKGVNNDLQLGESSPYDLCR
jgi:hypothetical protein